MLKEEQIQAIGMSNRLSKYVFAVDSIPPVSKLQSMPDSFGVNGLHGLLDIKAAYHSDRGRCFSVQKTKNTPPPKKLSIPPTALPGQFFRSSDEVIEGVKEYVRAYFGSDDVPF